MPLHVSSTVVLVIRRSKLYYTASGIITRAGVMVSKKQRVYRLQNTIIRERGSYCSTQYYPRHWTAVK